MKKILIVCFLFAAVFTACEKEEEYEDISLESLKCPCENDVPFIKKITGRITTKDRIVFTRQLATLIGAGLPLAQGLNTVLEQTDNKKLQSVVSEITNAVEGGKTLSSAFAKHPEIFDPVFLALVGAGEISGT